VDHGGIPAKERWTAGRVGLAAGACALLIAAASGGLLYARAVSAFRDEIRETLVRTASAAAQLVDVKLHERLVSREQEGTSDYARAVDPLARMLRGFDGLAYAYTCRLVNGRVRFVLDPTPAGDADGDGVDDKSHLGDIYPEPDAEMMAALTTGVPCFMDCPESDAWGTFVSGYAPLLDDGRLVGIVGVDMDAREYVSRQRGLMRAGLVGAVAALCASAAAGLVAARLRGRALSDRRRLETLLRQVDEARAAAETAAAAKARFLDTMSHELRTPMNGVLGMIGLLEGGPLDEEQREFAALARTSGQSLLTLIDDLLEASRLASGRVEVEQVPFAPANLAREAVLLLGHAAKPGVELRCDVGPAVPHVLIGDPGRLRQVLHNLLGNALKFTSQGHVDVRLATTPLDASRVELRITVADTGIGIPEDKIGQIFDEFTQADSSTTRRFGGTGLGLTIAHRLARLMGGDLTVSSREQVGSLFTLAVPVAVGG
jgi:signal transduction histidine kinase